MAAFIPRPKSGFCPTSLTFSDVPGVVPSTFPGVASMKEVIAKPIRNRSFIVVSFKSNLVPNGRRGGAQLRLQRKTTRWRVGVPLSSFEVRGYLHAGAQSNRAGCHVTGCPGGSGPGYVGFKRTDFWSRKAPLQKPYCSSTGSTSSFADAALPLRIALVRDTGVGPKATT